VITFVGFSYAKGATDTSAVVVNRSPAPGNAIVIVSNFQAQASGAGSGISISDGTADVYTLDDGSAGDSGAFGNNWYVWHNPSVASGVTTFTVTPGPSSSFQPLNVWVLEFSYTGTFDFDAAAAVFTGTTAAPTTNPVTTTKNADLLLGCFYSNGQGYAAAGGATLINSEQFGSLGLQYEIAGVAGTYTQSATFTASDPVIASVWAFSAVATTVLGTVAENVGGLRQSAQGEASAIGAVAENVGGLRQSAQGEASVIGTVAERVGALTQHAQGNSNMSSSVTLAYHATAVGPATVTNLELAMGAVGLDVSEIETATGCTFTSDTLSSAGQVVTRTVVFNLTPAEFQANFPAGTDQASPFYGLYTQRLQRFLSCPVTADAPVLA
jgi:hypothetical protein